MKELQKIKEKYIELTNGLIDYDKFNNYLITHHSIVIEGSTLTYQEVILLLDNDITPGSDKPFTQLLMAKDHLEALKHSLFLAEKKEKLTVENICEISALIMKNTGGSYDMMGGKFDSSKGEFRKGGVHVGTRSFVNYQKVPQLVKELVDYINKHIDAAHNYIENSTLAFDAHFQMVSIHPFIDGNGRLSRLLMNYIQHYHNHPLTPVLFESKKEYFDALEKTREEHNPDIFRDFMFSQSLKYFNSEIETITKQQETDKDKSTGFSFLF